MRTMNNSILIVEDDEEPIAVTDDTTGTPSQSAPRPTPGGNDDVEIEIENPTPGKGDEDAAALTPPHPQESSKHALATRLYKAVETAYSSVYELTDVLNEIGRRYKAPALKALGNQSINLQASIEGMPGLLDGKHEKEDVVRFMGLMDEITND